MGQNRLRIRIIGAGIFLLIFLVLGLESATFRVKVIVDNASVKETPEIGGKTLVRIALDTVLEAEEKQGEWYRVQVMREGVQLIGFIHEIYVGVVPEEEAATGVEESLGDQKGTQAAIIAEVQGKLAANKRMIRQEEDFQKAISALRPLIAKAFKISDNKQQREIAAETFLWIGLAFAKDGDEYAAQMEFKNMFEVDYSYAKEMIRNIFDSRLVSLIQHAENAFLGITTEYSFEILTNPAEAKIKIDGETVGVTPEVYKTTIPQFVLEIEKDGYKSVKEDVFLRQLSSKREYILERLGRTVNIRSSPPGARVFFDGQDTELLTDCQLVSVPFGMHTLRLAKENYVDWDDQIEIQDSLEPMTIEVRMTGLNYEFLEKWGGPLVRLFKQPAAITVDKEDNVYIADVSGVKIKKITSSGELISIWGNAGREFAVIKRPGGICVDSEGFIYVSDAQSHDIKIFNKEGKYISKWGKEGSKEQELRVPLGIVIDKNNDIYVTDSRNSRIKKYSRRGELKNMWGEQGASDGNFIFPFAIAVNQKNEIYVLDRNRVQKFSADGEFIDSWGGQGKADGELMRPMGIFIDQYNYVYVADSGNDRIQKFNEDGKFITKWGAAGKAEGQMDNPHGVAVDSSGFVFVVEKDNDRVQKFGVKSQ